MINLTEEHTPENRFAPTISWNPGNTLDTKDYFPLLQDTMSITFKVKATNIAGEDEDSVKITLQKAEDIDHFKVTLTPDTIFSSEYAVLSGIAIDKNGNEALIDGNTVINISADPASNFYIWDDNWDGRFTYSEVRAGSIYLGAGDDPNIPIREFTITVSALGTSPEGASGTGKLVIKRDPCMYISVSSNEITPGQVVDIKIQQLDCYGKLIEYPPDQYFYIWMNSDEKYGKLRDALNNEGSYLEGSQPFKFVAASNMDSNSTVVEIEAWTSNGGGGANSIGFTVKPGEVSDSSDVIISNDKKEKIPGISIEKLKKRLEGVKEDSPSKRKLAKILAKLEAKQKLKSAAKLKSLMKTRESAAVLKDFIMEEAESELKCKSVVYVTIKKEEECIFIDPEKKTLSSGETTLLYVKRGDGGIIPPTQMFDIELIGPEGDIGLLQSGVGVPDIKLIGVIPPITYIAPSSISVDSIVVQFMISKSGGAAASITNKIKRPMQDSTKINKDSTGLKAANDSYIQVMMSGCQIGSVTVENRCPNIKFDINGNHVEYPGMMDISDPRFKFIVSNQPAENLPACDEIDPKCNCVPPERIGVTGHANISTRIEGGTYSTGRGGSGSWYLDKVEITIPWGICTDKIKNLFGDNVIFVDETRNYPTDYAIAKAIIADFKKFTVAGVQGKFADLKYFPLVETREHERSHVNTQWKPIISEIYCETFLIIFDLPLPPSLWCIQDAENIQEWLDFKDYNIKSINRELNWALKEIDLRLNKLSDKEKDPNQAGYDAVQALIRKIQNDIDNDIIK